MNKWALAWLAVLGVAFTARAGELQTVLPMPESAQYVKECGSCHTAYAPTYLTAAAWRTLMARLDRHYGDDASLSPALRDTLTQQLEALAADTPRGVPSITQRNARWASNDALPRITQSAFFTFMHDEVPSSIWKRAKVGSKANCGACHPKADSGSYFEREIQIPK